MNNVEYGSLPGQFEATLFHTAQECPAIVGHKISIMKGTKLKS